MVFHTGSPALHLAVLLVSALYRPPAPCWDWTFSARHCPPVISSPAWDDYLPSVPRALKDKTVGHMVQILKICGTFSLGSFTHKQPIRFLPDPPNTMPPPWARAVSPHLQFRDLPPPTAHSRGYLWARGLPSAMRVPGDACSSIANRFSRISTSATVLPDYHRHRPAHIHHHHRLHRQLHVSWRKQAHA